MWGWGEGRTKRFLIARDSINCAIVLKWNMLFRYAIVGIIFPNRVNSSYLSQEIRIKYILLHPSPGKHILSMPGKYKMQSKQRRSFWLNMESEGRFPHQQIIIFASELASAIGRHKYASREETMRKVWLRSHKKSFCLAHSLLFKNEVIAIIASSDEAKNLQPLPDLETDGNSEQFVELMKKVILDDALKKVFFKVMSFIKGRVLESARESQILAASKVLGQVTHEVKVLCQNESKPVAEAVKEVCTRAGVEKKEVIAAVESKLTKERGTHLESKAIQDLWKARGIDKEVFEREEIYYRSIEYNGLRWRICGRPDAEMQDCIIEVKNRRNHFMCPTYDYIQLQTYLFLCNKPQGILLERLKGENKETIFPFNDHFWKDEVTPDLAMFVCEVCSCIEDYKQDLYGDNSSADLTKLGEDSCLATSEAPDKIAIDT